MPEKIIPEYIDPFRHAEQNLRLSGTVQIADMHRVSSSLDSTQGNVDVELQFGVDEQGVTFLKGHLEAGPMLVCQRCMEPFKYEIISSFVLGIVKTLDEANALPAHYEPALSQGGSLALHELIEDEIILNLPIIPKHGAEVCKVKLPLVDSSQAQHQDENPFHVLVSLKHKQR